MNGAAASALFSLLACTIYGVWLVAKCILNIRLLRVLRNIAAPALSLVLLITIHEVWFGSVESFVVFIIKAFFVFGSYGVLVAIFDHCAKLGLLQDVKGIMSLFAIKPGAHNQCDSSKDNRL
jgi:hypothetical protein